MGARTRSRTKGRTGRRGENARGVILHVASSTFRQPSNNIEEGEERVMEFRAGTEIFGTPLWQCWDSPIERSGEELQKIRAERRKRNIGDGPTKVVTHNDVPVKHGPRNGAIDV